MALLDEIKGEILQRKEQAPVQKTAAKPKGEKKPKTKAEIEAYRQKMIAKEEARYIKQQEAAPTSKPMPKPAPKPKAKKPAVQMGEAARPVQASKLAKPKPKPRVAGPKQLKTIVLPNGDSIVLFYVPGGAQ